MQKKILIVDDEEDICLLIQGLLEDEGYGVLTASKSAQAYDMIESKSPDLVIQDIWLQEKEGDGIDILKTVRKTHDNLPFIMISGHGTIETAVSAIKLGAYDFIEKPFQSDRMLLMIHRALETAALKQQNAALKQLTAQKTHNTARQIPQDIRSSLDKIAATNSRVLITGEPGTGKNIAARYIHEKSQRTDMPFMVLNCAGTESGKLEETLFGTSARPGILELADGGTLLLDEVARLPADMQGKILVFLQDSAWYKPGSDRKISANIRIVATTGADIAAHVKNGAFRGDLYYRLNVVPIHMPALRKRRQDIPALVTDYTSRTFSGAAIAKLQSCAWPGNIRQLHNVLEWIAIMHGGKETPVDIADLPPELTGNSGAGEDATDSLFIDSLMQMGLRAAREHFERHYLLRQVQNFDGNISKTAAFIGMERSALHRKLKSLDVFSDDRQDAA